MRLVFSLFVFVIITSLSSVYAEEYIIDIPFGAYNPELNTPAEVWYDPPQIFITVGDKITWYNDDRESHTVTSGDGPGRFGWMDNKEFGTPDGIFDSGNFPPGESWSYEFKEPGNFSYFCIIHPWMEGIVIVEKEIPDFPHDATGKELEFPLYKIGSDLACHLPLLKKVASYNKPVILSTGMCTMTEIQDSVKTILDQGNDKIMLLHCVSDYPANAEESNLNAILEMKKEFCVNLQKLQHMI